MAKHFYQGTQTTCERHKCVRRHWNIMCDSINYSALIPFVLMYRQSYSNTNSFAISTTFPQTQNPFHSPLAHGKTETLNFLVLFSFFFSARSFGRSFTFSLTDI